jgi:DNA-binding transcriptional LysR family regulator
MKNADIKQLALLCELMETQSLTEAALRMAITPSAASQSLARLRDTLGDQVCLRQGPDYHLTPYGELAMDRFRQVVALWREASEELDGFDPATCTDRLSIACSEAAAIVDPAELYAHVALQAPGVLLDLQSAENSLTDIVALRAAQVDLVCTHLPPPADAGDLHAAQLGA